MRHPYSGTSITGTSFSFSRWQCLGSIQIRTHATSSKKIALPAVEKGEALIWAITSKLGADQGQLIGIMDYRLLDSPLDNRGFWLSEEHHGKGWMSEAIIATQDYVFFEYGVEQLTLSNAVTNPASRRLKQKYDVEYLETATLEHHNGDCIQERWRITRENWARFRGKAAALT